MLDLKKLKKIIDELEEKNLFNNFISILLDYNLLEFNKMIIRYKIDNSLIIDVFNYKEENKFIRYYFTNNDNYIEFNDNNVIVRTINIKDYYNNFDDCSRYSLFSSLFYEKDINTIKLNLKKLFNDEINSIIINNL